MSCTPAANMYARGLTLDFGMQRVAVCPGVLQCVAELTLDFYVQCVAVCRIMLHHALVWCNVLKDSL